MSFLLSRFPKTLLIGPSARALGNRRHIIAFTLELSTLLLSNIHTFVDGTFLCN